MGIFKRISDLLSANFNDLLDQCENPEKMLKQAVREMEAALGRLMDGAARAIAHERLLSRQLSEQEREIERHRRLAEAAVAKGDDGTARRELAFKIEHQRLAERLDEQVATAGTLSRRLRDQVTAMRIKLAEARHKLLEVTARNQAAQARRKFVDHLPSGTCGFTAASNFERLCTRIEQSEAETEALLELLGDSSAESLNADVEAELSALKEKAHHAP